MSRSGKKKMSNKSLIWIVAIEVAVLLGLVAFLLWIFLSKPTTPETTNPVTENTVPTGTIPLEKAAHEYTYEEYMALTPEYQVYFPDAFESMDDFNRWYEAAQAAVTEPVTEMIMPTIDLGGKQPEEFTWDEYQALPPEEQALFPDLFKDMAAFNAWMERAQAAATEPEVTGTEPEQFVDIGEKQPEEFTWEDYQALSIEDRALFPDLFESFGAFQEWYNRECPDA